MTPTQNATQKFVNDANISLKEHFDRILAERKEHQDRVLEERRIYFVSRIEAIEKGIEIAKQESALRIEAASEANERRLAILNEFRSTVDDWMDRSATKDQIEGLRKELILEDDKVCLLIRQLEKDIDVINSKLANMSGKEDQTKVLIALGFSVLAVLFTVIDLAYTLFVN